MPKLIVSIEGVTVKNVDLIKAQTTVGRRPYNDVVIDNLSVSGEHAIVHLHGHQAEIQDLGSTNGTFINGARVQRQWLLHGDQIDIGKYRIRFELQEPTTPDFQQTIIVHPGSTPLPVMAAPRAMAPVTSHASLTAGIRVLTGPAAGREMLITKVVTTLGKPGTAVASITRRQHGYVLTHVEGLERPRLNGQDIGSGPMPLTGGDRIALAGTEMEFLLQ